MRNLVSHKFRRSHREMHPLHGLNSQTNTSSQILVRDDLFERPSLIWSAHYHLLI